MLTLTIFVTLRVTFILDLVTLTLICHRFTLTLCALILLETSALYKLFTYLLTYLLTFCDLVTLTLTLPVTLTMSNLCSTVTFSLTLICLCVTMIRSVTFAMSCCCLTLTFSETSTLRLHDGSFDDDCPPLLNESCICTRRKRTISLSVRTSQCRILYAHVQAAAFRQNTLQ